MTRQLEKRLPLHGAGKFIYLLTCGSRLYGITPFFLIIKYVLTDHYLWAALKIQRESSCEGFFRQTQQKPQGILDLSPRIFVKYDGNKTCRFDCDEFIEVTLYKKAYNVCDTPPTSYAFNFIKLKESAKEQGETTPCLLE